MKTHEGLVIALADRNEGLPGWAGKPLAPSKFQRDKSELPRYAKIEGEFKQKAQEIVRTFADGKATREQTLYNFKRALYEAETHAFVAGKRSSGDPVYFITPGEQKMLTGRHSRNMRYFSRFVRQIEGGKTRMPIERRAALYASSLWSLYNRGQSGRDWDDELSQNARYLWVMDPDAEHCPDCIERWRESEAKGGFTWDELIEVGFPGEGTECTVHCRCHIQRVIKRVMETSRAQKATETEGPEEGRELLERILGGNQMPLKVPAAGTPPLKVSPLTIAQAIENAGDQGEALARKVPLIVSVLTKPEKVIEESSGARVFTGQGLAVRAAQSRDGGAWAVVALYLLDGNGSPQGNSYVAPWLS